MPHAPHPDSTIAMLRDPCGFIAKTCTRLGTDVCLTCSMWRPTICMTGLEAVAVFYAEMRFIRMQTAPGRIAAMLRSQGVVHNMRLANDPA